jgi:hypothetical protein
MLYAALKAALSGLLVALISESARRSPALGALVASLPVISVLAMIWLWRETGDAERIAAHAQATFWYVLPSLPLFLVLPALLRSGAGFYVALGLSCVMTVILYGLMVWTLRRFGISL